MKIWVQKAVSIMCIRWYVFHIKLEMIHEQNTLTISDYKSACHKEAAENTCNDNIGVYETDSSWNKQANISWNILRLSKCYVHTKQNE